MGRIRRHALTSVASICFLTAGMFANAQTPAGMVPQYVVAPGNMHLNNGVSHGDDTDYIALSVTGPDTGKFAAIQGPVNVGAGDTYIWKFGSSPIKVKDDKNAILVIKWSVANIGHSGADEFMHDLLGKALPDGIPNPIVLIGIPFAGVFTNCDTGLFAQLIQFDGARLANGLNGVDGWRQESPNQWIKTYHYPNIKSQCSTGDYTLDVRIIRSYTKE